MGKSIILFFRGKPFGVFSNKTNSYSAIERNYDISSLCVLNDKETACLPATYANVTSKLSKTNKCLIFERSAMQVQDAGNNAETPKISPVIHVLQFETNVATDGKLYKSGEPTEGQSIVPVEESEETSDSVEECYEKKNGR